MIETLKKWQRRERIANNKIRAIQNKINKLAIEISKKDIKK